MLVPTKPIAGSREATDVSSAYHVNMLASAPLCSFISCNYFISRLAKRAVLSYDDP